MIPTLDLLGLALEGRASELGPEDRGRALAALAAIAAALAAAPALNPLPAAKSEREGGLLTLEAAAALAGLTPEAFRRRRAFRPAIVKLGRRTLRVSESRLRRILLARCG